jgi:hypothetical protein
VSIGDTILHILGTNAETGDTMHQWYRYSGNHRNKFTPQVYSCNSIIHQGFGKSETSWWYC